MSHSVKQRFARNYPQAPSYPQIRTAGLEYRSVYHHCGFMRWSVWETVRDASTDGLVRSEALKELGISPGTIVYNCGPSGHWQRILPGIILLHNGRPDDHQRLTATIIYAGREAVLTGDASLRLQGFDRPTDFVDVLLPQTRTRKSAKFVRIERTWRIPEPVTRGGFPCAPIPRAVLDASRRMTSLSACRALLAQVVQRGAASVADLWFELEQGSSRGSALPRRVLRELDDNAHSVAEIDAQRLYRSSELPPMSHNCDVLDSDGAFLGRPDGWIDSVAMAWEIDSIAHHMSPADHKRTLLKRERMQAAGIVVISHLPAQISESPELVLDQLRTAYRRARERPRPDVTAAER